MAQTTRLRPDGLSGTVAGPFAGPLAGWLGRPCLECDPGSPDAAHTVRAWLERRRPRTLNVAGPSEASCPGIEAQALALLTAVFSESPAGDGERSR